MTVVTHQGPGPNTRNLFKKQPEGPSFHFGSEAKLSKKKGGVPGPGYYKVPTHVGKTPAYAGVTAVEGGKYKYV
jgi:hypothetical protein